MATESEKKIRRERIAKIREMMTDFRWVRGVTGEQLADEWSISVRTVETYAAEASNQINLTVEEKEHLIARVEANLMSNARACGILARACMADRTQRRTAVEALKASRDTVLALARYRGLDKATRDGYKHVSVPIDELKLLLHSAGYSVEKLPEKDDK